jgi:hypothetical protein
MYIGEFDPGVNPDHPSFDDNVVHYDEESGQVFQSPFEVIAYGLDAECFGIGTVVGRISDILVVKVEDCEDGQAYYVSDADAFWEFPPFDEVLEQINHGQIILDSVAAYRSKIDRINRYSMRHEEDRRSRHDVPSNQGRNFCLPHQIARYYDE